MTVHEAIQLVRDRGSDLAKPVEVKGMPPMTFRCALSDHAATEAELSVLPFECPQELRDFWMEVVTARLFEDQEYGQWGLEILDPKRATELTALYGEERHKDSRSGDLVVGQFLGDSDLLIVRCDQVADDFGAVVVALPLDPRADWNVVGESFAAFLEEYIVTGGEKFWAV